MWGSAELCAAVRQERGSGGCVRSCCPQRKQGVKGSVWGSAEKRAAVRQERGSGGWGEGMGKEEWRTGSVYGTWGWWGRCKRPMAAPCCLWAGACLYVVLPRYQHPFCTFLVVGFHGTAVCAAYAVR